MIQALSPNTPQKAFTDGIGTRRMIRCFQYLDAARCCHSSETGSKLTIMITNEILRRLSIRSGLPQLLSGPRVGRRSRHPDMDLCWLLWTPINDSAGKFCPDKWTRQGEEGRVEEKDQKEMLHADVKEA